MPRPENWSRAYGLNLGTVGYGAELSVKICGVELGVVAHGAEPLPCQRHGGIHANIGVLPRRHGLWRRGMLAQRRGSGTDF